MAEYYSQYDRRPDKRRRSVAGWLFELLMVVVTLLVAVTMLLTFLVPYVDPVYVWVFPVLGLVAPATYVLTVLLALYWIVRWRWGLAGVMLVLVVFGLFKVSLFYRPDIRRIYPAENGYDRSAFKVMTYNVRNFYANDGGNSVSKIMQLIDATDPDIVCLQEFNVRLADRCDEFALLDTKYEKILFGRTEAPDSISAPMLILSKFRILRSGTILTPGSAVWADVLIGDDTVRVFNNHLRSTAITASDNEYITNRLLTDTARDVRIRSIVSRFRGNSILRAVQVDSIRQVVGQTRTRRIVCGDFNDTPMSYAYRTMARGLQDAFRKCGSGYSYTFRGFYNTLRIDYVLSSEGFETLSYEVPKVDYSDHYPVVVELRKQDYSNN